MVSRGVVMVSTSLDSFADWNEMPHRRYQLDLLADHALLFDEGISAALQKYHAAWVQKAEAKGPLSNEQRLFYSQFDLNNYTKTPLQGDQIQVAFNTPDGLDAKLSVERKGQSSSSQQWA